MGNTLDQGSGRPAVNKTIGDYTVAAVATRVVTASPTDADWGAEPPPNGTMVWESGILWVRLDGTWQTPLQ